MNIIISDYLESKEYNTNKYANILCNLEEKLTSIKDLDIKISFSLSAKYQTPLVVIDKTKDSILHIDFIIENINNVLEEFYCTCYDMEEKRTFYKIDYNE
jgi:hypothetical protein